MFNLETCIKYMIVGIFLVLEQGIQNSFFSEWEEMA